MLDMNSPSGRIIFSALKLAETKGWRDLSLGEIASEAGVPLTGLRTEFKSKADILSGFTRAVDEAVLQKFASLGPDVPRDRLFDVILTRFEIMEAYKPSIRRIREDVGNFSGEALSQLAPALKSQYWMLAAAGINGEGGLGLLRIQGLLAVYSRVFDIWLNDDDPGMARTMAALDSRLRRGESVMRRIAGLRDGLENFGRVLRRRRGAGRTSAETSSDGSQPSAAPQQI